ncbi:MAG TPA: hypothetical protein VM537_36300 [Anaerolineae bacterium]|nr:hypothetical protein [Anaerolineae bacterium]
MIEGYRVVLTQREAYWIGAVTADPKNRRYLRILRRLFLRRLRRSGYLAGRWAWILYDHGTLDLVCRNAQAESIKALGRAFGLDRWNHSIKLSRGLWLCPMGNMSSPNQPVLRFENYQRRALDRVEKLYGVRLGD